MVGVLLIDGVASEDELQHQHQQQGANDDEGVLLIEPVDSAPTVVREKRFLLAAALLGGLVGYKRGYYGNIYTFKVYD